MQTAETKNLWSKFPKIELHRHLEGAFDLKTLFRIARKNKLDVPVDFPSFKNEFQFPKDSDPDFHLFLSKFKNNWYRSLEDVYTITYESVKSFKKDNLFYIELRFNPESFAIFNNFDRAEVTSLVLEAGNKAALEIGLKIKYLITFNRGQRDLDYFLSLYEKLLTINKPEIVGVDLAGDEVNYPVKQFTKLFTAVNQDRRYKATIHAGEVTPSSEIWEAIKLHAARIGHGTTTIQDPKLQDYLTDNRIALEQCITSNYQTGSWRDSKTHPMNPLYHKGVPVTINSDDPTIQNTELSEDYGKAEKLFGFTFDDFVNLNLTAIQTSFITSSEKETLQNGYLEAVGDFKENAAQPKLPIY
ncbi:MAG: adenosine deaminase [Spirochaetales bacterium]|jgi:adenosine deaminase|nr:adenosine deaminase [Spirochaetales bacterium]